MSSITRKVAFWSSIDNADFQNFAEEHEFRAGDNRGERIGLLQVRWSYNLQTNEMTFTKNMMLSGRVT